LLNATSSGHVCGVHGTITTSSPNRCQHRPQNSYT
jgi:hypothetical protein